MGVRRERCGWEEGGLWVGGGRGVGVRRERCGWEEGGLWVGEVWVGGR